MSPLSCSSRLYLFLYSINFAVTDIFRHQGLTFSVLHLVVFYLLPHQLVLSLLGFVPPLLVLANADLLIQLLLLELHLDLQLLYYLLKLLNMCGLPDAFIATWLMFRGVKRVEGEWIGGWTLEVLSLVNRA